MANYFGDHRGVMARNEMRRPVACPKAAAGSVSRDLIGASMNLYEQGFHRDRDPRATQVPYRAERTALRRVRSRGSSFWTRDRRPSPVGLCSRLPTSWLHAEPGVEAHVRQTGGTVFPDFSGSLSTLTVRLSIPVKELMEGYERGRRESLAIRWT